MNQPDLLILCGGGLDSGAMAAFAVKEHNPLLLFFDYGQKAMRGESMAVEAIADRFDLARETIRVPYAVIAPSALTEGEMSRDQSRNEVPGRNLLFLAMAFSYAHRFPSMRDIWIGSDRPAIPPGFGDQKQATFDGFNVTTAFAYGEKSPRVHAPLLRYERKAQFIYEACGLYPELFAETFSCYESSSYEECGECNHCKVKAAVLAEVERM